MKKNDKTFYITSIISMFLFISVSFIVFTNIFFNNSILKKTETCKECNQVLYSDSNYCSNCGATISNKAIELETKKRQKLKNELIQEIKFEEIQNSSTDSSNTIQNQYLCPY